MPEVSFTFGDDVPLPQSPVAPTVSSSGALSLGLPEIGISSAEIITPSSSVELQNSSSLKDVVAPSSKDVSASSSSFVMITSPIYVVNETPPTSKSVLENASSGVESILKICNTFLSSKSKSYGGRVPSSIFHATSAFGIVDGSASVAME
ncbi:uncharacterized protein LOC113320685 [Papaver somniferum]|nr:uncharacterized protein LOC113320685 [Papaver somniferum]